MIVAQLKDSIALKYAPWTDNNWNGVSIVCFHHHVCTAVLNNGCGDSIACASGHRFISASASDVWPSYYIVNGDDEKNHKYETQKSIGKYIKGLWCF